MSSGEIEETRILVADDEEINRTTLGKIFRDQGYAVSSAASSAETLSLLKSSTPDLLFLDVNLGNESGLDLLRVIKSNPDFRHVYVVMITAHRISSNDQALGLEIGADGYLVRPLERRELIARTEAFLRHKRTVDALRRSETRLRTIIDKNPDAILVVNKGGQIRFANPSAEQLFRVSMGELMSRTFGFPIVSGEHTEIQVVRSDRAASFAEMRTIDIDWDEEESFLTSVRDITDRKYVEAALAASEQRYRSLFEHAADGILVHNEAGAIVDVNEAFCRLLGYTKEEFVEQQLADLHPDDVASVDQLRSGAITAFDTRFVTKDGRVFEGAVSTTRLDIGQEGPVFLTIVRDVSERVRSREVLERELEEKRVLLRELYHRTKNNMQVISSMLRLKRATVSDEAASEGFDDINNRILAMSLVHEKLYESNNLSRLNFRDYLKGLASLLEFSLGAVERGIKITTTSCDHSVEFDVAVPLGQIMTELVTNSIKHGFQNRDRGTISISVRAPDRQSIELEYRDDGVGLPEGFDMREHGNMGLQTVRLMVEDQLHGTIEHIPDAGARFRIRL